MPILRWCGWVGGGWSTDPCFSPEGIFLSKSCYDYLRVIVTYLLWRKLVIETTLKNTSHSKDRHVLRTIILLGHPIFDHLTLQKSSGITVDGVQFDGVDHTAPGFCTKEMHYPTESHVARSRGPAPRTS